ncbi:hypothetical protein BDV95DRAFT_44174 [Massariosphaeria phaeospora]|uniref:BTB domain-containing protein n=1 Tax=Massariosphaeria phaeospora TaxID=100035 RepID=A0A7C8M8E5_9PLEO|nr:hypothetical protein BDV95DRAFT_44174 [Massariosphaeria phaeospora]
MDRVRRSTPHPSNYRAATVSNFDDNVRDTSVQTTRQPSMKPVSVSQASITDDALMSGELQASSEPIDAQYNGEPVAEDVNAAQLNDGKSEDGMGFGLYQQFYKTPITIKFGDKLDEECIVHLELLSRYSSQIQRTFKNAQILHEQYAAARLLRLELKELQPPACATDAFTGSHKDDLIQKAHTLIMKCHSSYPLVLYRDQVRERIEKAIDVLFQDDRCFKVPPSKAGFKRKDFPCAEVRNRLQLLFPQLFQKIVYELLVSLLKVKKKELKAAEKDHVKAAAQGKIFLPKFDRRTIEFFMFWLYTREFRFEDAHQLCKLHTLAEELGVRDLAATCLSRLSNAHLSTIELAYANGYDLKGLLDGSASKLFKQGIQDGSTDGLADAATAVFRYVLIEKGPSEAIQELVLEAVADSRDFGLYLELIEPALNRKALARLLQKMFKRTKKRQPAPRDTKVKSEISSAEKSDDVPDSDSEPDLDSGIGR